MNKLRWEHPFQSIFAMFAVARAHLLGNTVETVDVVDSEEGYSSLGLRGLAAAKQYRRRFAENLDVNDISKRDDKEEKKNE